MARQVGDINLSLREKRKDAQIAALQARLEAEKAAHKVTKARIKEVRAQARSLVRLH
jgi:hypothetical protein